MKSKLGFTLTELLAVIVLLAILASLSSVIYINVQHNLSEKQRENLITYISTKAEEYASNLNLQDITYVNVEMLIEDGYIETDDGKYVYDPADDNIMNCYVFKVEYKEGEYNASLDKKENYLDGACNVDYITSSSVNIVCGEDKSTCLNDWYNDNIVLSIDSEELSEEDLNNSSITWSNLVGLSKQGKTLTTEAMSILDTVYTVNISYAEKTFKATRRIKIDKEKPTVVVDDYILSSGENKWMSAAGIKVVAHDSASGIDEVKYCITTDNNCDPDQLYEDKVELSSDKSAQIVCFQAKDKVGNISEVVCSDAYKVDKIKPEININVSSSVDGENGWKKKIIFEGVGTDVESGVAKIRYCITDQSECKPTTDIDPTNANVELPSNKDAQRVCYLVIDTAGNYSDVKCSDAYKVDNTAPKVTNVTETSPRPSRLALNVTASDDDSGVGTYYYKLENQGYVSSTSSSYTYTGLKGTTTYLVTVYVKDVAGNESEVYSTSFTTEDYEFDLNLGYSSSSQTLTIEESGYYQLDAYGAQGSSYSGSYVGGKGGYISGKIYLEEGDVLTIRTGGQDGTNGGGKSSYSGTYNGGGATTIKLGTTTLITGAGGGGASPRGSGGAGGNGTGAGGSSAGAGSGTSGSSGGGGSSSPNYTWCDERYCPSGGSLSGTTCTIEYECYCPSGYTQSGSSCKKCNNLVCNYGGTLSGGTCTGSSYTAGGESTSYKCFYGNGMAEWWVQSSNSWGTTSCATGYSLSTSSTSLPNTCTVGNLFEATSAITGTESTTYNCTWSGNYSAQCNSYSYESLICPDDYVYTASCYNYETTYGYSGSGGKSSVGSGVTQLSKTDGTRSGNGYAKITFLSF